MSNLSYLFAAHLVFWIVVFFYIYFLVRKNRKLRKDIDALKESFKSQEQEEVTWRRHRQEAK